MESGTTLIYFFFVLDLHGTSTENETVSHIDLFALDDCNHVLIWR
jgi:hypothetical protein